jgi:hypothetical protein
MKGEEKRSGGENGWVESKGEEEEEEWVSNTILHLHFKKLITPYARPFKF